MKTIIIKYDKPTPSKNAITWLDFGEVVEIMSSYTFVDDEDNIFSHIEFNKHLTVKEESDLIEHSKNIIDENPRNQMNLLNANNTNHNKDYFN